MNKHVYKQIELTGSSKTSIEEAVQSAIAKASETLHDLRRFQIVESLDILRWQSEFLAGND